MSLVRILEQIESNRPNAEMSLEMVSPSTYNARVGIKRAAIENIARLNAEYQDALLGQTAFIIVTGSSKDSFTEIASGEKFGCFSVDPEGLFTEIASKIDQSLYGRESARYLFSTASNLLEEKAMDLGIKSYNMLQFSDKYNSGIKTASDFVTLLRNAVVDQVGSEIIGLNAVRNIVSKAISSKHSASVTPVILNTSDEKFALELQNNLKIHKSKNGEGRGLTNKVFLVVAGKASKGFHNGKDGLMVKNVTEETVEEALALIRNKV